MSGAANGSMGAGAAPSAAGSNNSAGNGTSSNAGGGVSPGSVPSGGGTSVDWTHGMNDGHKAYVSQKGFKDPVSVLDSYINMEKLMGVPQDRLLKLPSKPDDPAWGDVYERLGRPRDPKEYQLEIPKGGDETFAGWARSAFHELGLSKSAGEKLAAKWNEYVQGTQTQRTQVTAQKAALEEAGLKKEWGAAFDKHVAMAQNAAKSFGLDGDTLDRLESSMGYVGALKFLHGMASRVGEAQFVSGGSGGKGYNGVMPPDAARGRIEALRGDSDFVRRYAAGESSAKEEMERLHKMAYPE